MNGYILVDKPQGWTSFDVVAKIRGIARAASGNKKIKVGHAGTLDPMATGLLIVLVGSETKNQDSFMKQDKVYEAEITLGATSDTYDAEGNIEKISSIKPTKEKVNEIVNDFIGELEQMPPAYSALKINGKKAYELARAGKPVELKSRKITVYGINDIEYLYPKIKITAKVSSGTYIRSLAHDIGGQLGCGAYLSKLRRTDIAGYKLSKASKIEDISTETIDQKLVSIND